MVSGYNIKIGNEEYIAVTPEPKPLNHVFVVNLVNNVPFYKTEKDNLLFFEGPWKFPIGNPIIDGKLSKISFEDLPEDQKDKCKLFVNPPTYAFFKLTEKYTENA